MMTPSEENALRLEVEKLRKQNEQIKKLITVSGFFELYFAECRLQKFRQDAFDVVNELHKTLLGEYKYNSYEYFKKVQTRYYKSEKK